MKKLIVALAIAGSAMFSAQAAKCYWGFTSLANTDEKFADAANLTDYTAYLVTAYNWETYGYGGLSQHASASLAYDDWSGKTYNEANKRSNFAIRNGTLATDLRNLNSGESTTYGVGDSAAFYLVLADDSGYAAYQTGNAEILADNSTAKYNDEGMTTAYISTFTDGKGYVAASDIQSVPEPTSGLLLLLGVAGLALKRKRA